MFRPRHGNVGVLIALLAIVTGLLIWFSIVQERDQKIMNPTPIPTSTWPEFNCQEDEIMAWVDARKTAECINIEEFEAML